MFQLCLLFKFQLIQVELKNKEAFAKAITNAAVDILKAKRQHVIITYDERPSENWYISGEQL
jgi:4-oxalocrotonate tautomerase